ncbi:hypothetical protein B0H17DRAFT_1130255 [Mycena rosella]|uniref:Ricin B lectin domain-containing protein n=1 Tax=Mycena rosella TaxID=1033263 RepID=A0AAD7DQX7_MYCRO|nr:hypothetical protein B0H17DRAFT_1130255 [Mycena rosella]
MPEALIKYDEGPRGKLLPTRGTLFPSRHEALVFHWATWILVNVALFLLPAATSSIAILLLGSRLEISGHGAPEELAYKKTVKYAVYVRYIIALGLGALTLATAAPSQLVISCAISQSGSATTQSRPNIVPGVYRISNGAADGALWTSKEQWAEVALLKSDWDGGPVQTWCVEPIGGDRYHIVSVLRGAPVAYDSPSGNLFIPRRGLRTWYKTEFTIQHAGGGTFTVKIPDNDQVWTIAAADTVITPIKLLPANGAAAQRWEFTRLIERTYSTT